MHAELYTLETSFFTFKRADAKSRIDAICLSSAFKIKTYTHKDMGFSDHDLIMTKIIFESTFDRGAGI